MNSDVSLDLAVDQIHRNRNYVPWCCRQYRNCASMDILAEDWIMLDRDYQSPLDR